MTKVRSECGENLESHEYGKRHAHGVTKKLQRKPCISYLTEFLWTTGLGTEDDISTEVTTDGGLVPPSNESDLKAFILGVCTVLTMGTGCEAEMSGAEVELMIRGVEGVLSGVREEQEGVRDLLLSLGSFIERFRFNRSVAILFSSRLRVKYFSSPCRMLTTFLLNSESYLSLKDSSCVEDLRLCSEEVSLEDLSSSIVLVSLRRFSIFLASPMIRFISSMVKSLFLRLSSIILLISNRLFSSMFEHMSLVRIITLGSKCFLLSQEA